MSSGSGKRLRENEILSYIERHVDKILEVHGLSKENALFVTELVFPHGRADAVIYGLYEDLYVVPIGIEVKTSIKSGTELYYYINQLRETYEYAFPIIYLATNRLEDGGRKKEEESKKRNIIRDYLNEIGYGLIEVDRDDISISLPANPKKTPKSEYDYCEVASKGLLYLATAKVLKDKVLKERRFERALKVSSLWIGIDANISYCGFTRGSYAVFGVYAWGSSSVKQLLEFILNEESLVEDLAKAGYRVYVESYLTAMGRVIGYVRHLDETLYMSTVEAIHKIMKKKNKLSMIRGWGMGLGIYRPLWEAFFMPSYPTALQMINRTMDELAHFRDLVVSSLTRSRAESKE